MYFIPKTINITTDNTTPTVCNILTILFPIVLCGGHAIVEELSLTTTLSLLLLMLIAKFLFSIIKLFLIIL